MIPVLFVGIAIMFLFLALASHLIKSNLKKPHDKILEIIEREIAREKQSAQGYAPAATYFYKTIKWHYRFEIAGFVIAAIAAFIEYLSTSGWR